MKMIMVIEFDFGDADTPEHGHRRIEELVKIIRKET